MHFAAKSLVGESMGRIFRSQSSQREVLRPLFWAVELQRKALSSLTREDFMLFEAFLSDPGSSLVLTRQSSCKPAGPAPRLSLQSRQHAIGILSNLFNYLVSAGYLATNPLALRRGRRRKVQEFKRPERFLDEELWSFVLESIERWPKNTHRQLQHYERSRWTIRFLPHHLTATAIYLITKEIFRRASIYRELADLAGAATLARASTHWIRHTAASNQANADVDLRFV